MVPLLPQRDVSKLERTGTLLKLKDQLSKSDADARVQCLFYIPGEEYCPCICKYYQHNHREIFRRAASILAKDVDKIEKEDFTAVNLERPLGGMLLYSPWAGFSTDYPSFNNEALDMMSPICLRKWSAMFLDKAHPADPEADPGPVSGDAWTEPCLNPASWWSGSHQVVNGIFISYRSYEVLADSIKELEQELKRGWVEGGGDANQVTFVGAPKEAHIGPIQDIMTPGKSSHKSETQVAIEAWYKARLQK